MVLKLAPLTLKTRLTSRPKMLEVCLTPREPESLMEEVTHHRMAVGPSEVPLEHLVVEAEPLVVASQTCAGQSGKRVRLLRLCVDICSDGLIRAAHGTLAALAATSTETPRLKGFLMCLPFTTGLDREPGTLPNTAVSLNPAGL